MKTELSIAEALRAPLAPRPIAADLVLRRLERIRVGKLTLTDGARRYELGEATQDALHARVEVHDARFWSSILWRGSVGAGEAYARGWWTSAEPTAVVRLFLRNRATVSQIESGVARLSRPVLAAFHALRRNTLRGSRENVRAHYDLSNEFFELFLDETLTYSCGIFEHEGASLREASIAKIDRLCRKLELGPGDRLLEIGTGWGALAMHAARHYGCRVTTTTLSARQLELASERVRAARLADRVELLNLDYRSLRGTYDKLVSVEMIEAIGHQNYDDFFQRCSNLLAPHGSMALQAITIGDQHYESARRSVDFIQRHIFPGSCIPSVTALCTAMSRSDDLRLVHMEDIGLHYARTLAHWRHNLLAHWRDAQRLGFTEEFLRRWEFYLCYCEGGFAERHLGTAQMLFTRVAAGTAMPA